MGLIHKKILGIEVTFSQKAIILKEIEKYLKTFNIKHKTFNKKKISPLIIYTPNPEIISFAGKDKKFMEIVNTAQINLPDSRGIVWAAEKTFGEKIEKISGSDFIWDLTELAAKKGFTVGLIGGRNGVALETKECLQRKYPRLKIEVLGEPNVEIRNSKLEIRNLNPKFGNEKIYWNDLISKIRIKNISILIVAMGYPKQEIFIKHLAFNIEHLKLNIPIVLMAVGGTFDYISGRVSRAPLFIRNMGFEWLYRLIREPQRLGRQIKGMKFFWDIFTS